MKITFCGAAKIVTGSCTLVEAAGSRLLVDCGMFQGSKELIRLNFMPFRFEPGEISHMILTHTHVDHAGLIPKLVKEGFGGKITATAATADLAEIILEDCASIQEMDTEHENRRRSREGLEPREPLFRVEDALESMKLLRKVRYDETFDVAPGIEGRFRDAGHILGSAILELFVTESGKKTKLVFSGDLGQWGAPIVRDPTIVEEADCVFVESTYGDRLHEDIGSRDQQLMQAIQETSRRRGKLMIPSFAIERTQELLFTMGRLMGTSGFPDVKIYVDSPLAIKATEVFKRHRECFDEEALKHFARSGASSRIVYCETPEASMELNSAEGPCVIIAGSGMCTGGRIRHHFKHGLWDARNMVLFVGYQAAGTLGRIILDGAREVKMMGMKIAVKARVGSIGSFSAHSDYKGLMRWMNGFAPKPGKVFVVHGEPEAAGSLKGRLDAAGFSSRVPGIGDQVELT